MVKMIGESKRVFKGDYPHPLTNMDLKVFTDYAERVMNMETSDYNKNSCNKERDRKKPYSTYKLTEPVDMWGDYAEVRVLKCWNSPKRFLNKVETLRVLTCVKSENTHGSWEYGDMDWLAIASLISEGKLVETQRDSDWSIFEFRGVLQTMIAETKKEPEACYSHLARQLYELLETGRKNNLSFDKLKELAIQSSDDIKDFSELVQETQKKDEKPYVAFGYTTRNKTINHLLSDLSQAFEGCDESEIGFLLTYVLKVLTSVKKRQAKDSNNVDDFISRSGETGMIELMFALLEESKELEKVVERFMQGDINNKGVIDYEKSDIPKA